ncbi:uncharacterized protein DMAD_02045 [Drosophila madeirensis]|uniref:Uncharacterized protein n=1 Tax=Drosophila madeirensis TaxID=30013 RepID=A0AAU9G4E2_DROMD
MDCSKKQRPWRIDSQFGDGEGQAVLPYPHVPQPNCLSWVPQYLTYGDLMEAVDKGFDPKQLHPANKCWSALKSLGRSLFEWPMMPSIRTSEHLASPGYLSVTTTLSHPPLGSLSSVCGSCRSTPAPQQPNK